MQKQLILLFVLVMVCIVALTKAANASTMQHPTTAGMDVLVEARLVDKDKGMWEVLKGDYFLFTEDPTMVEWLTYTYKNWQEVVIDEIIDGGVQGEVYTLSFEFTVAVPDEDNWDSIETVWAYYNARYE